MMCYSTEPRDEYLWKAMNFYFAKYMAKNLDKNVSRNYGQKPLDHAKQSATDEFTTASKNYFKKHQK